MSAFGCCAPVTNTDCEVIVNEPDSASWERYEKFRLANFTDDYFEAGTTWKRACEVEGACLFGPSGPKATDVLQHGKSKHGWFLAACASLAHMHPDYIRTLIKDEGDGAYVVKLYSYAKGVWIQIDVEDWLPVDANSKLAIGGLGKQLAFWPALLQQAAGQYIGSYKAMDYADPAFALGMLTGVTPSYGLDKNDDSSEYSIYPYNAFTTDRPNDYDFDKHFSSDSECEFAESEVISKIQELLGEGYVMCAASETRATAVIAASVKDGQVQILQQKRSVDDLEEAFEGVNAGWFNIADLQGDLKYITFVKFTPPLV